MSCKELLCDFSLENNQQVCSVTDARNALNNNYIEIKRSFGKLLLKLHGLPARQELVELFTVVAYNYCCMTVLMKRQNCKSSHRHEPKQPYDTWSVDDVVAMVVDQVMQIKKGYKVCDFSATTTRASCSRQLIGEMLSDWFPCAKVPVILLLLVCEIHYIESSDIGNAVELAKMLMNIPPLKEGSLSKDVCSKYSLLPVLATTDLKQWSTMSDFVHLVTSVAFLHCTDIEAALVQIRSIQSSALGTFCQYVEGFLLYRQHDCKSAVKILSALYSSKDLHPDVRLKTIFLLGNCYSAQGKHHMAIQMYKKCLTLDFSFLQPLYNVAVEYKHLGLYDAEIETLQLLIKLLHNDGDSSDASTIISSSASYCLLPVCQLMKYVSLECEVLTEQRILYRLATRCVDLKRYALGSETFNRYLTSLTEQRINNTDDMPDIGTVYEQVISCHFEAGLYKETVDICDRVLKILNYIPSELDSITISPVSNVRDSQSSSSSKRLVCMEPSFKDTLLLVKVMFYKTRTFERLGQYDEALECINSAITDLERLLKSPVTSPPPPKRLCSAEDCQGDASINSWQILLSDMYYAKCRLVTHLNQNQATALHFARLAAILEPDNIDKTHILVKTLLKMQHLQEGYCYWLSKRNIDISSIDCFQFDQLIKQRSSGLGITTLENECAGSDDDGAREYLLLDLEALKYLRSVKHGHS